MLYVLIKKPAESVKISRFRFFCKYYVIPKPADLLSVKSVRRARLIFGNLNFIYKKYHEIEKYVKGI